MKAPQRTRNKVKIGALLGVLVILLLGLGLVWSFSILGRGPSMLEAELRSANTDGMPLNAEQLRAEVAVDERLNAAPQLKLALEDYRAWKDSSDGKAVYKVMGNSANSVSLKPADVERVGPVVSHLSRLYSLLSAAAQKPKLDFHRTWEQGPGLMFPELVQEKSCVALLLVKAQYERQAGDVDAALTSLALASKISSLVGQDPVLIGMLIGCSLQSQVCDALSGILKSHATDQKVREKVRIILNDQDPVPDIRKVIRTEFVMGRLALKMLADHRVGAEIFGSDNGNRVTRLAEFGPIRTVFELRYAQVYHGIYKGLLQRPDSIISMRQTFKRAEADLNRNSSHDWTYALAELMAPIFSAMPLLLGENEARRNVLLSAIDVLEAKDKSGRYPERALGDSGHWVDPFTEKPLTYRVTGAGFIVYSFARDGKDDGGKPRPHNASDETFDIPFSYP